jgi:hypothetical protein
LRQPDAGLVELAHGLGRHAQGQHLELALSGPTLHRPDADATFLGLTDLVMRVNVLCSREGAGFHVDSLELYSARQRAQYVTMAAHELAVEEQVIKRDLGSVLLKLEELQDKKLKPAGDDKSGRPELSDEEREAAMALLRRAVDHADLHPGLHPQTPSRATRPVSDPPGSVGTRPRTLTSMLRADGSRRRAFFLSTAAESVGQARR